MSKAYYSGLDALRFVAAMLVCIFHLGFYSWASFGSTTAEALDHVVSFEQLTPFSWFGWVGVEIFFVISGFVIANSANGASAAAFLRGRILRLYPAAWICATLTLIMLVLFVHEQSPLSAMGYLRTMTLWPKGPWIDGAYWSLAVEISFYTVIFVMLVFRRFSLLPVVAAMLTVGSAGYTLLHLAILAGWMGEPSWLKPFEQLADNLLLKHGMFFALGIWLWILSRRQLRVLGWTGLIAAVALGVGEIARRTFEMETLEAHPSINQPGLLPAMIWLAAVLLMMLMVLTPERFTPKAQRTRELLRQLGLATYPLYLLQNVFGASLLHGLVDAGLPGYVSLIVAIAIVLASAFTVALLAEPAVRRALRSLLSTAGRWAAGIRPFGFMFRPSDTI